MAEVSEAGALYIDSHCHLADPRWAAELGQVLERASDAGVGRFLQGGVDPEDWERQRELVRRYPGRVWPVFGLHPWWVRDPARTEAEIESALALLEKAVREPDVRAVGEVGLDFAGDPAFREGEIRDRQLRVFERQLEIAEQAGKPVVLHVVRAHGEVLQILERRGRLARGGLSHAFSGSLEIARRSIELGLLISVGGSVVRKKGFETLKRAVVKIPPEALVIESDAPDQAPEGWCERTGLGWNEPSSVLEVARAVAELRGERAEEVLERSARNLLRVFGE